MASIDEERTAFDQVAGQLRDAAAAAARGLQANRGASAGDALDSQLEHTLDRLATLYGHGTFENLSTEDIIQTVLSQPPAGWQLPAPADGTALFGLFRDPKQAYAALIGGGRSGFNAALRGRRPIQPGGAGLFEQQYVYGYYWAAGGVSAQFSSVSSQASASSPAPNAATAL